MITKRLTTAGLVSAMMMTLVSTASGAVDVDKDGKVKLYGDMRYRVEMDTRADNASADRDRDRSRLRARLGVKYKADNGWGGNIRVATNSENNQSPPPHIWHISK